MSVFMSIFKPFFIKSIVTVILIFSSVLSSFAIDFGKVHYHNDQFVPVATQMPMMLIPNYEQPQFAQRRYVRNVYSFKCQSAEQCIPKQYSTNGYAVHSGGIQKIAQRF